MHDQRVHTRDWQAFHEGRIDALDLLQMVIDETERAYTVQTQSVFVRAYARALLQAVARLRTASEQELGRPVPDRYRRAGERS